ncbi:hypothetical protein DFQ27_004987 [Actinomortierella ambigua]|uniref:Uncharacterized protein n=1 Tax=Actinomortierella ambigua TaxID=1343610 RepID=A0A9P6UCH2_9FUNG|nr:hypothetical protein DFQ27_004987 [Actinomortierella ambigua]
MKAQIRSRMQCLLLLAVALGTVAAETALIPRPRSAASYAKFHNKLYIHAGYGGNIQPIPYTQLYALDLSKPWKSTSPAWLRISEGPDFGNNRTYSTVSHDGKILMIMPGIRTPGYLYYIEQDLWVQINATFRKSTMDAFPVTLGESGAVLITAGSRDDQYALSVNEYDIYSLAGDNTTTRDLPATVSSGPLFMPNRQDYRAVWSHYLERAVLYGGRAETSEESRWVSDTVSLYDPLKDQWSEMSGYKALVTLPEGSQNLNTSNQTIDFDKISSPVEIYNISSNAWVADYEPTEEYMNPYNPNLRRKSESEEPNTKHIVGGAVGAVVVVMAALIGVFVWKRKRSRKHDTINSSSVDDDRDNDANTRLQSILKHASRRTTPGAKHTAPSPMALEATAPKVTSEPHFPEWGTNYDQYATDESPEWCDGNDTDNYTTTTTTTATASPTVQTIDPTRAARATRALQSTITQPMSPHSPPTRSPTLMYDYYHMPSPATATIGYETETESETETEMSSTVASPPLPGMMRPPPRNPQAFSDKQELAESLSEFDTKEWEPDAAGPAVGSHDRSSLV